MKIQSLALVFVLAGIFAACAPKKNEQAAAPNAAMVGSWLWSKNFNSVESDDGSQYIDNQPSAKGYMLLTVNADFSVNILNAILESSESDQSMSIGQLVRLNEQEATLALAPGVPGAPGEIHFKLKSDGSAALTFEAQKTEISLTKADAKQLNDLAQKTSEYRKFVSAQKELLKIQLGGRKFKLVEKQHKYFSDGKEGGYSEDISLLPDESQFGDYIKVNPKRIQFSLDLEQVMLNDKHSEKSIFTSLEDKSGLLLSSERTIGANTTTSDLTGKITLTTDGFTIMTDSTYIDKNKNVTRNISVSKYVQAQ